MILGIKFRAIVPTTPRQLSFQFFAARDFANPDFCASRHGFFQIFWRAASAMIFGSFQTSGGVQSRAKLKTDFISPDFVLYLRDFF